MEQERGGDDRDRRLREIIQQAGAGRQVQPPPFPPPQCPRCDSPNTKFCYYNNYSLNQPRYFCKACKRYWTQGGTLRDVPMGGGSRKGKRAKNVVSFSGLQQPPQQPPQPPPQPLPQEVVQPQQQPNFTTVMTSQDPSPAVAPSTNPFYQGGGGYLASLEWPQNMTSEASLWSTTSITSTSGSNTQRNASAFGSSPPLTPNQLPDLPSYGPP